MVENSRVAWWAPFLEPLYKVGARAYHQSFDAGLRPQIELPVPVVSVGNLVVGGTGKTPAVLGLVQALLTAGKTPVVLTRGYKGTRSRGVLLDGKWEGESEATAVESGDEPLLLSRALPGVFIVVGKRRGHEARTFLERGRRADVFVLDDGFQHRSLKRDRDLVLLDHRSPLGNRRFLPAGPLRESPRALRRATHVIFTGGSRGTPPEDSALETVARYAGPSPWSRAWLSFDRMDPLNPAGTPAPPLKGLEAMAVAGIARPERFGRFLEDHGVRVRECRWFRDHHPFTSGEVRELETQARGQGVVLLTTQKDAVRLAKKTDGTLPWFVVKTSLELEGGWGKLLTGIGDADSG